MATATTPRRRVKGFIALLLLTAGALVLAGRVVPFVGDALALVLGIELLVLARLDRGDGPLISGGVLVGLGTGVLLAAGPLLGAEPHQVGGAFLLCLAGGFALIAVLGYAWQHQTQPWAWITALALAVVGGSLAAGPGTLATLASWALPAVLLGAGVVLAARWMRGRAR
jgi:hypothetical protein